MVLKPTIFTLSAPNQFSKRLSKMSTALFDTAINSESPHGDERNLRVKFAPLFEKIKAGAVEREKSRTLPIAQVQELVAAGFGAVRVGKEFGGAGANLTEFFELLIDLAAADSNVAHLFRGHFVFLDDISLTGTSEANRRWSYRAVSGAVIANASSEQGGQGRSEEHTSELQSRGHLVCRLLLEKKNNERLIVYK